MDKKRIIYNLDGTVLRYECGETKGGCVCDLEPGHTGLHLESDWGITYWEDSECDPPPPVPIPRPPPQNGI